METFANSNLGDYLAAMLIRQLADQNDLTLWSEITYFGNFEELAHFAHLCKKLYVGIQSLFALLFATMTREVTIERKLIHNFTLNATKIYSLSFSFCIFTKKDTTKTTNLRFRKCSSFLRVG